MRLNRFFYLIKEGVKSIFTHGFMSFASVTVIIACLIIMGSFSLLAVNVDNIISGYEQENSILAFVDEELEGEEVQDIQPRLLAIENVREVTFISREEAMETFVEEHGGREKYSDLDATVLRDRYVIYLSDIALMAATEADIKEVRGVADVSAHLEISQGFITVRNVVTIISVVLIAILLVVSTFIMANTIKLATFGRKEEIAIMKIVGASNFFIRCPFVIEGLILGLVGGGLAFVIEWGIYTLVSDEVMSGSISSLISVIPFDALKWPLLAVYAGVGLIVGVFGSNIAIRNYLKV